MVGPRRSQRPVNPYRIIIRIGVEQTIIPNVMIPADPKTGRPAIYGDQTRVNRIIPGQERPNANWNKVMEILNTPTPTVSFPPADDDGQQAIQPKLPPASSLSNVMRPTISSPALPLPTQQSIEASVAKLSEDKKALVFEFLQKNPDATINRIYQFIQSLLSAEQEPNYQRH